MSRTLDEWLQARDDWRRAYNLKISSFPYPDKNSIVYERASNNDFWERRRIHAAANVPFESFTFTAEDTFKFIGDVAASERAKEEEFLRKFFPKGEIHGNNITDDFNILFQSRERYERLLERMKNAKDRAKSGWKGMAPNMDALFASYLNQRLNKVLQDFRASFTATTPYSQLEGEFKQLVDQAIVDTINDVAAVTTEDEIYGSGRDWQEIAQIMNSDPYLRSEFVNNMRAAIGHANIEQVLKTMYSEKSNKGKKKKTSTILRENLKLSTRTASIGGNVIENTMAALAQALGGIRGNNGSISYSVSGSAIGGEMVVTDAALVFSASAEVDTSRAVQALNESLSANSGSLAGAYDAINKFYESQKAALDELYTVFINSKNYQLGSKYGTYHQHHSGLLSELDDFLARAHVNANITDDFLNAAYNTAAGAIYAGQQGTLVDSITNALKAAAVNFMFDDWQSIGGMSGNGIHMFLLSGKYVPSSVIFGAMADAGNSIVSAKAHVSIPGIDDPGPSGWDGGTDVEIKNAILNHWNSEYARISASARWTADFVIKVKAAIGL